MNETQDNRKVTVKIRSKAGTAKLVKVPYSKLTEWKNDFRRWETPKGFRIVEISAPV